MVSWLFLPLVFALGALFGIFVIALCDANNDKKKGDPET